ncbi:alpha/beta fold hydrolase [Rhodococcoides kyotonense]|uniref:Acyl-CoA synthetase (AMP-forming)/AMP-acid ligase II n=1 Tax=Rhodococcoides kyotonense TaxID=398843 RepID=A0A239N4J5_9NOCA|nr:alpha/beta fold hydrolase [Rhodococcus kyotonensis]SNT49947.1 Acyl-CoA synthetase (AMP-forming)/AMP-acid ligase II [Rhodococcus kyotonensis]
MSTGFSSTGLPSTGLSGTGSVVRSRVALAPLGRPDARDTVLGRLCEVAHAVPAATALVTDDGSITFDELLHRTYAVARKIATIAPTEAEPVAVETASTIDAVVLMFAVFASGRVLVPLDQHLPEARREQIVVQAGARRLGIEDIASIEDSSTPLPVVTGDHIALIAFTSGSTGAAKGVLLSNRMCLSKAYEVSSTLGLSGRHRVGNALPVSFGAGINTLLAGVLSGSQVHCRDPRTEHAANFTEWVTTNHLTTLHCSPSLVRALSAIPSADRLFPSLQYVVTYGEALHSRDVTQFRRESDCAATFVNWYATTEAGAVARMHYGLDTPLPDGFLDAGRCPAGKSVDIVRSDGILARPGEVGQVRVTGDCFADGYLDMPEQTALRFTDDSGRRRYWTGDLGRIDERGVLHLVGRIDDAVKIRGYLVEPAEVESAVRSLDGVSDAVVVASEDNAVLELAVFFVGDVVTDADVRGALRETLPDWMVPKFVTRLDAIPRTHRGKVDRAALPPVPVRVAEAAETVLSGTTEYWLALIVARELDLNQMHRDADFAELGATSLVTTRILVEIRQAFHVELAPADLVSAMTVRLLAALIDERLAEAERNHGSPKNPILVPLRAEGTGSPLFVVAGAGVPAVGLAPLARRLTGRPLYALQAKGLDARAFPHRTISCAARAYVREIQKVQPHGPYTLAGHSLGAWIALEMAHVLESHGETVEHLVLLDPRLYRWLLDKVPGAGPHLESAPPEPDGPRYKPGLRTVMRQITQVAAAGIVRFRTTDRWLTFGLIGSMALRRHTPKAWDGSVTVVVTESNTSSRASWEALAPGRLDITPVPGEHIGLVREPVVTTVAEVIDRALESRR